jgi:hypothetical protein
MAKLNPFDLYDIFVSVQSSLCMYPIATVCPMSPA